VRDFGWMEDEWKENSSKMLKDGRETNGNEKVTVTLRYVLKTKDKL